MHCTFVGYYWQGITEVLGEKPVSVPMCLPQEPYELAWNGTQACTAKG